MEPTGHYWFNLGKYLQDKDVYMAAKKSGQIHQSL